MSKLEREIPETVEAAEELESIIDESIGEVEAALSVDEERDQLRAKCDALDKDIAAVVLAIAVKRRDKDVLLAKKDELLTRIEELRPKPGEELQRHLRVQQKARAARNVNIQAAALVLQAAGVNAPSPIDAAMKNRPRPKPNGAR